MPETAHILNNLTEEFLNVHTTKEDLFWETKMGLGVDPHESQVKLSKAEIGAQQFLQNGQTLKNLTELEDGALAEEQKKILNGWIRLFQAHAIEDPKVQALSEEIVRLE